MLEEEVEDDDDEDVEVKLDGIRVDEECDHVVGPDIVEEMSSCRW